MQLTSRTLVFAEQSLTANIQPGLYGHYLVKNVSSYSSRFPFRHGNNANLVFADGHIEQRKSAGLNDWLTRDRTLSSPDGMSFQYYKQGIIEIN
ncbi:MAG: hypothetical protein RBT25_01915 [Lentisphaeria bacterium]|nr:hypothetical protein [Lentisphaeria bacterium]NLZ60688.1 hypothetical protein [Lentisphaerota bacterium]